MVEYALLKYDSYTNGRCKEIKVTYWASNIANEVWSVTVGCLDIERLN